MEQDIQVDEDAIFLEAIGGLNKNETVYGVGNESATYYQRSTSAYRSASYTPSVISQIQSRFKKSEAELLDTRQELKNIREDFGKQIASLKFLIESPSHPPPPPPLS